MKGLVSYSVRERIDNIVQKVKEIVEKEYPEHGVVIKTWKESTFDKAVHIAKFSYPKIPKFEWNHKTDFHFTDAAKKLKVYENIKQRGSMTMFRFKLLSKKIEKLVEQ